MGRDYESRRLPDEPSRDAHPRLLGAAAAPVADVLHALGHWGCSPFGLRALTPDAGTRFAGRAITLAYERGGGAEQVVDAPFLANEVIERARPGDVLVIATGGAPYAFWGDHMAARAIESGLSGSVLDGAIRDRDAIAVTGFPIVGTGCTPESYFGRLHAVRYNEPVTIAGVVITPGDLVVADADGVTVVPAALADRAEQGIAAIEAMEAWVDAAREDGIPPAEVYAEVQRRMAAISEL